LRKFVVHNLPHHALDVAVAQLALGLSLKLRVGQFDRNDGAQTLADIVARGFFGQALEKVVGIGIGVETACHGRTKTAQVCPAFLGIDVVGKRKQNLVVPVVPLQGHFDHHITARVFEIHNRVMHWGFALVQVLNKTFESSVIQKIVFLLGAFIPDDNVHPFVQKGQLAKPL